jgi:hypothetical protein
VTEHTPHPPARAHEAPYVAPHESVEFDREIQYHQLIWMGIALLGIAVVSAVLVFFMLRSFVHWRATSTETAPVMRAQPMTQSEPPLLARPEAELARVRDEEAKQLEGYGWVDAAAGVAHIPIERAIDIVAARGLPARAPATAEVTAAPDATSAPAPPAASTAPPAVPATPPPGASH